jgi:inorganic pyrophosphatase
MNNSSQNPRKGVGVTCPFPVLSFVGARIRGLDWRSVSIHRTWYTLISKSAISDLPDMLMERLRHYFGTYKLIPREPSQLSIEQVYDHEHAFRVVTAAIEDYTEEYGAD